MSGLPDVLDNVFSSRILKSLFPKKVVPLKKYYTNDWYMLYGSGDALCYYDFKKTTGV